MKIGNTEITWEQVRHVLLWMALPIVIGLVISAAIPRPIVGLIRLDTSIDSYSASDMIAQIQYARQDPAVRAVVLLLDSPGGTVADTESIYQEILLLRRTKPVVTSVGSMAASGAYYLSVATDYIVSNPTSQVGNIGVIGYLPNAPMIFESIISTGPYKLWGEPRDTYLREMEMIKQQFYLAVTTGRGDRLTAGPEVILTGRIWPGSEAFRLGLVDALGSQTDAVMKAAGLAHISNYQVFDLRDLMGTLAPSGDSDFFYQNEQGVTLPYPDKAGIFLLYIPPVTAEK